MKIYVLFRYQIVLRRNNYLFLSLFWCERHVFSLNICLYSLNNHRLEVLNVYVMFQYQIVFKKENKFHMQFMHKLNHMFSPFNVYLFTFDLDIQTCRYQSFTIKQHLVYIS